MSPVQTLSHSGGKEGRDVEEGREGDREEGRKGGREERKEGREVMQVTSLLGNTCSPWTLVPQ